MKKIKVCSVDEITSGEALQVELEERPPLAVYNLEGDFYVTDDTCTHGDASLAEGDIEGDEIVCPFHLGKFDIRTGEVTAAPCSEPIQTYPVEIEDGNVFAILETEDG